MAVGSGWSLFVLFVWLFLAVAAAQNQEKGALANETTKGNETEPGFETTMELIERVALLTVTGWEALYSTELVVDPTEEVTVLVIPVKTSAGEREIPARYNITMTIPDPPEGCWPNETLWFTTAVYFPELCLERNWEGECTLPSADGFTDPSQYHDLDWSLFDFEAPKISQYEYLYRTPEEIKAKIRYRKTLKGAFCYKDKDYWMAFTTSCPENITIKIDVGTKEVTAREKWTCKGFDYFIVAQKGSDAFLTSKLFWAIIVPIGYFAFLIALVFGCCYFCQCGATGRVPLLLNFDLDLDFDQSEGEEEEERVHRKKKK